MWLPGDVMEKCAAFDFDDETKKVLARVFAMCHETAIELEDRLPNDSESSMNVVQRTRWAVGTTRDAKEQIRRHINSIGIVMNGLETYVCRKQNLFVDEG